jgi:hypothetical protein
MVQRAARREIDAAIIGVKQLINPYLRGQSDQAEGVPGAGVDDQQAPGGFEVAGLEEPEMAMPADGISFPSKASLGGDDTIFTGILSVQAGRRTGFRPWQ